MVASVRAPAPEALRAPTWLVLGVSRGGFDTIYSLRRMRIPIAIICRSSRQCKLHTGEPVHDHDLPASGLERLYVDATRR